MAHSSCATHQTHYVAVHFRAAVVKALDVRATGTATVLSFPA